MGRRGRRGASALIALLLSLALVAAACGSDDDDGGGGATEDTTEDTGPQGELNFGWQSPPTNLDPHVGGAGGLGDIIYVRPVYDTLLDNSSPDGELKASVATEWEVDGLTVNLTLRDDVSFPDGTKITADVVVQNLLRVRDKVIETGTGTQQIATATAIDETHVSFTVPDPDSEILNSLGGKIGMIINPAAFSTDLTQTPSGSGPYELVASESTVNVNYVYTPRENYWAPERQKLERLELTVLTEAVARSNAIQSGEIDATVVGVDNAVSLEGNADITLVTTPKVFYGMVIRDRLGTQVPAFKEVKVRQALAYAIDREAFVEAVAQGYGSPVSQMTGPGYSGYDPELDELYDYDVDKAKDLLAEAGYADGFEFDAAASPDLVNFITAMSGFFDEIGVTINITQLEQATYAADVPTKTGYPVFLANLPGTNVVQIGGLVIEEDGRLNPYKVPPDPALQALYDEIQVTTDPAEFETKVAEFQREILEQGIIVVAATGDSVAAHTDKVTKLVWGPYDPTPNILDITVAG